MTLAETLLKQLENPALSRDERAQLQCQIAADFEHRGEYESARDALAELWQGVGERPALEGLAELTAAEVLLRVGSLSAWFGSVGQIVEAQEKAKDLITESITRFQAMGETTRVAAARSELGLCYRRAGSYDDARVVYQEALRELADGVEKELRAKILLRLVIVESLSGRYKDALRILTNETQFFEESANDFLKGKFHNELACALTSLGQAEHRPDYTDRAIIEYTAASHHFEQAGHTSYRASAENNLGFLLYTIGRYEEAHEHLNAARRLFADMQNQGRIAQVDETRARVLLAQGRLHPAESAIREAVRVLSKGDEHGLLAEARTTQGRILSRLGNFVESLSTLRRAADLAEEAGAVEDAGRALLSLMEEHTDRIIEDELLETYERAHNLLKETQDADTITRLRACAMRIISNRRAVLSQRRVRSLADFWANFDLNEKIHTYEARYVRQALIDGEGSVTRAARLLGLHHHATLAAMLDEAQGRHKDLAHLRTPPETRKQSIINRSSRRPGRPRSKARTINILCVEDYPPVADAVKETLEELGWAVELCGDGAEAMRKIESKARYHLLILDNQLPGKDGLELARRAQQLPHRRRTPIIMLSASDVERDALRAGVNAFLRKPQDIRRLTATVTRLLTKDLPGRSE
ncbi:MAG: two-component system, sensor histidine kinase and response regulator [Pyrinomonadaceae bacterium]|nr:two-component system, sensor histidine kinase and response regulator [Pyrinomonadaceae bacterium]